MNKHKPRIEAAKLRSNRTKRIAEDRMINYVLAKTLDLKDNYGADFALKETVSYLNTWKNRNRDTEKKAIRRLHELGNLIRAEKEINLDVKSVPVILREERYEQY